MSHYSIDYLQLQRLAQETGLSLDAAELHGRMLGLMCVEAEQSAQSTQLLQRLVGETDSALIEPAALAAAVEQLYRETWDALDGAGLGFSLLLPEQGGYSERYRSLTDWARGFMGGLAIAGIDQDHDLALNGQHALADLARFAGLDGGTPEDEQEALEEAGEFVWVSAVLVRELLQVEQAAR